MADTATRWPLRYSPADAARWRAEGKWTDRTVVDCAREVVERNPSLPIIIDNGVPVTAKTIFDQATILAQNMRARGLRAGDVMSFQLPNWYEAAVIALAGNMLGLVAAPLVPIYRDAEVGFMLADSRSRIVFVPQVFRRFDYVEMLKRLKPDLPALETVVVVRGEPGPFTSWDAMLAPPSKIFRLPAIDPDAPKLMMYTSGTTGHPKGVLHSHNTLMCELESGRGLFEPTADDVIFMPSPVSHITGYALALELSWVWGISAVLMDTWSGERAVEMMRDYHCSMTVAATPFLRELVAAADEMGEELPRFRRFACGGASVPPELVRKALEVFPNCVVFRVYGSTEAPTVTQGPRTRDDVRILADTDGIVWNNDVRIADPETGRYLERGEEGEIVVRGPELFLGYSRPADNEGAFDSEGFFRTGDLGILTDDDCIVVTGRKKDLIIRGGENISPKEIEDALFTHPAIADVAVVGAPSERMGECVCAYVVLKPGSTLDIPELARHLGELGLAKQKVPERLEFVDELPRTASGKVRKNVLRDQLLAGSSP